MPEDRIGGALLTFFASGGTLDRALTDLPEFTPQIRAAVDWMSNNGHCTATELTLRANCLRDIIHRKDEAIRFWDFDLAAKLRGEECALFESVGLTKPAGETWFTVLRIGIEKQLLDLSALLREVQSIECEPGAAPNGGAGTRLGNAKAGDRPPSVS